MAKKKLKAQGRTNFQVDNKIREELLAKAQAEEEKEKKRMEKQALQRAEVEKIRKANLEEQATFIFNARKKESAESVKNDEADNTMSLVKEKSNNENSAEVLKDFDNDGIWDEDYGNYTKSNKLSTKAPGKSSANKVDNEFDDIWDDNVEENSSYQSSQKGSVNNTRHSSYPNYAANNKRFNEVPGKNSANNVVNGIDDIWDENFEENSSHQSSQKASVNNTQHSSYPKQRNQQQWQTACPQKKEQGYRRNNNFQREEKSQYSNKEQRVNRFQTGRYRRDTERSVVSNKSENWNFKNTSHKPVNTEAESVWDTPDWPTVGESIAAAAPTVNVWEERMAKMESVQQMAPHSDREEEHMLQQALAMSIRQAAEDEKKQRDIAKQFELQQKCLELNPEILSEIQQHTNINSCDDLKVHSQARSSVEAVKPLAPSAINGQNMSSYCNGARPKYASASNPSSSRRTSVLEDVWTNSEGEDVDITNTVEANKHDDSPAEDAWGDYIQPPLPSNAEIAYSRNTDIIVENSSLKNSQRVFESRENECEEIEDEDKQSFYEISSEHEEISYQNISSHISLNEDFRQKFGGLSLENATTEQNEVSGMFQTDESSTNDRYSRLMEEKSALPGMTSDLYGDAIKNYPNITENIVDNFNSLGSNASLKSLARHHDKTSIPFREQFEKAADKGKQHTVYFDRSTFANTTPPSQCDDNGNMMHAASGIGTTEVNHAKSENLHISSIPYLPAMDNVKRWVESTNIDSDHYVNYTDSGIESSSQLGNGYRSDADLKSPHAEINSVHSNLPNSMCLNSINPPVQPETNLPINPVPDNQGSNAENPANWNFMSLPNSTASFNPPFITPNPAMAFAPTMVPTLPVPNLPTLTEFELQQLLLLSNSFFGRQFLISQNHVRQMYQQFVGLQGAPHVASAGLIQPNSFGQMQAPTSLPQFSAPTGLPQFSAPTTLPQFSTPTGLPQFSAPTSLPQLSTPAVPFTSAAPNGPFVSMAPQNLSTISQEPPNVPNISFAASRPQQFGLNPMQANTPVLPPGLYNNPRPPNARVPEDLMRSLNSELLQNDTSVGIPPPRPACSRQPKQSASELCPLMQQASLQYNTERLLALENSNYQRAPFGNV